MTNEIKDLKCLGALGNLQSFAIDGTKGSIIVDINVNIIKNYITNLQEENKRSQQKINKALNRLNRIPDGLENINAYVALIVNETKEILQGDNKE